MAADHAGDCVATANTQVDAQPMTTAAEHAGGCVATANTQADKQPIMSLAYPAFLLKPSKFAYIVISRVTTAKTSAEVSCRCAAATTYLGRCVGMRLQRSAPQDLRSLHRPYRWMEGSRSTSTSP